MLLTPRRGADRRRLPECLEAHVTCQERRPQAANGLPGRSLTETNDGIQYDGGPSQPAGLPSGCATIGTPAAAGQRARTTRPGEAEGEGVVKPARFSYYDPTSVDEALALLAEHGEG